MSCDIFGPAIFGPKMAHLSETNFFWYKPLLFLSLRIVPFNCAKFKEILTADPELWSICPKQFFLENH